MTFPLEMRVACYEQLALGTPPSAVGANITSAISIVRPELVGIDGALRVPSVGALRSWRTELGFLGEACAAMRLAECKRIRSLTFDETTKFQVGTMTVSVEVETTSGALQEFTLRCAFVHEAGTAEIVAGSIDSKVLRRLKSRLELVKETWLQLNSGKAWKGPDPENIGLHRLGDGMMLMSDTCNGARAAKRVLQTLIESSVEEFHGAQWATMGAAEKEQAKLVIVADCHAHMRNILIGAMIPAMAAELKSRFADSLEGFSSFERVSFDVHQLVRAVFKEFHHNGDYAKGHGKDFETDRKVLFSKKPYCHASNARVPAPPLASSARRFKHLRRRRPAYGPMATSL